MVYNKVLEFFSNSKGIHCTSLANCRSLLNIEYTSDSRAEIHVSAMTLSLMLYSFMMTRFPPKECHILYIDILSSTYQKLPSLCHVLCVI